MYIWLFGIIAMNTVFTKRWLFFKYFKFIISFNNMFHRYYAIYVNK